MVVIGDQVGSQSQPGEAQRAVQQSWVLQSRYPCRFDGAPRRPLITGFIAQSRPGGKLA